MSSRYATSTTQTYSYLATECSELVFSGPIGTNPSTQETLHTLLAAGNFHRRSLVVEIAN